MGLNKGMNSACISNDKIVRNNSPENWKGRQNIKGKRGFTLIELLVVISLIAILATIAISAYLNFAAKSRQTEVKYNLGGIYKAETSWYGEHAAFDNNFSIIGWSPEGVCAYSYSVGGEVAGKNPPDVRPVGTPMAGTSSFSAYGWGNIDTDPTIDVWHIDEQNNLVPDVDDVNS